MCEIYFEEAVDLWNEHRVCARKHHTCSCCGGTIRPGEEYTRHFSVFDGQATSEKQCAACTTIVDEFATEHGGAFVPSQMLEAVHECYVQERDHDRKNAARWLRAYRQMLRRKEAGAHRVELNE